MLRFFGVKFDSKMLLEFSYVVVRRFIKVWGGVSTLGVWTNILRTCFFGPVEIAKVLSGVRPPCRSMVLHVQQGRGSTSPGIPFGLWADWKGGRGPVGRRARWDSSGWGPWGFTRSRRTSSRGGLGGRPTVSTVKVWCVTGVFWTGPACPGPLSPRSFFRSRCRRDLKGEKGLSSLMPSLFPAPAPGAEPPSNPLPGHRCAPGGPRQWPAGRGRPFVHCPRRARAPPLLPASLRLGARPGGSVLGCFYFPFLSFGGR